MEPHAQRHEASVDSDTTDPGPHGRAMQHARDRAREITNRHRLLVPVDDVVQDVNRFLRGWSGYFVTETLPDRSTTSTSTR